MAPPLVAAQLSAEDAGEVAVVLRCEPVESQGVVRPAACGLPRLLELKDGELFRALAEGNTLTVTHTRTNTRGETR